MVKGHIKKLFIITILIVIITVLFSINSSVLFAQQKYLGTYAITMLDDGDGKYLAGYNSTIRTPTQTLVFEREAHKKFNKFTFVGLNGKDFSNSIAKIAIIGENDCYVRLTNNVDPYDELICDGAGIIDKYSTFYYINLGNNKFALKAYDGRYISRINITTKNSDNYYIIGAYNMKYNPVTSRRSITDNETFMFD